MNDFDLGEDHYLENIKRQFPDEEIGWCGPGTWGVLVLKDWGLKHDVLEIAGLGDFSYWVIDGTKIFMSPWAEEGKIIFSGDSLPIEGLDFASL